MAGEDHIGRELGAVVADDHSWLAAPGDKIGELARHTAAGDRGISDRGEAFPGHVIDDVEHPEPPAAGELVMDKVQAPAGIGPCFDKDRSPCTHSPAPRPPFANSQALFPIQPVDPVDARGLAFTTEQNMQPTIAEPTPFVREFPQATAQFRFRRPPRRVTDHRTIRADKRAGPALGQSHHGLQMRDSFALSGGPYHFFDRSSRSAAASSS